jgi:multidrug resistance efflux pump
LDSEPAPFLDPAPAPWAARGLAWLLIALFAVAVVASVAVRVPETVSSRFVLVASKGVDQVRASRDGIVAEVRAAETQPFGKGEPLFVIRSSQVGDRSAELTGLEAQLRGATERLANERRRYESQRLADDEEDARLRGRLAHVSQQLGEQGAIRENRQAQYRAALAINDNEIEVTKQEIEFRKQQYTIARELADRSESYYKAGVLSWLEHSNRQLEASKAGTSVQQLAKQLESARLKERQLTSEEQQREIEWKLNLDQLMTERKAIGAAIDKLRHEQAAHRSAFDELERGLREETEKARIRSAALTAELGQSRGNEQIVLAPCAGVLLRLSVRRPGAVVKEGEPLGDLACDGSGLQAELTVTASGAGQIKPGQRVKLLYDSFPYQRFGVRHATVRWVSPATVDGQFRAFADVDDQAIVVAGERRSLSVGMGGRADVITGRRQLIAYAFEPLRQLHENLAPVPPDPGRSR